jgi:hypothetical protein
MASFLHQWSFAFADQYDVEGTLFRSPTARFPRHRRPEASNRTTATSVSIRGTELRLGHAVIHLGLGVPVIEHSDLRDGGGLSTTRLPNVIEEALQICSHLGEDYLWADRLCIIQDDDQDKAEQIGSMAEIFSTATFTLVIACGSSMDARLPGVNTDRNVVAGCADIQGLRFRSELPTFAHTIEASQWYTRGWTYQEGVLAGRKLFITPSQAMRLCPAGLICEDANSNETHSCRESKFQPRLSGRRIWIAMDVIGRHRCFPPTICKHIDHLPAQQSRSTSSHCAPSTTWAKYLSSGKYSRRIRCP